MEKSSTEYLKTQFERNFANLISEEITSEFKGIQSEIIKEIDVDDLTVSDYELGIFISSLFFFQITTLIKDFTQIGWSHFYLRISLLANEQGWLETNKVASLLGDGGKAFDSMEPTIISITSQADFNFKEGINSTDQLEKYTLEMVKKMKGLLNSYSSLPEAERRLSNLISEELEKKISNKLVSFYPNLRNVTQALGPIPQIEPVYLVMGEYVPNEHPSSRKTEIMDGRKQFNKGSVFLVSFLIFLVFLLLLTS